ncbi:hypothetical protein CHH78_05080 [Shouchella clausii]|uniref:Uncharacterized protein n=1 Tax=Shouchella clausii TaxID=79880 RepID=A0A268S347_SHOCL|nr:hypothetical protein BC8716_08415 [Shouchella clausii]PAD10145.1 hypothetical protein CHH76_05770 [Shouchella clausii]PAD17312.1 hypothetical protein CHH74_02110 [Shouchella clausii]PAE85682.1 hypothetical protein CHH78_05080 [Shouchella clausii]PAE98432.1 hypothetical protein CHH71_04410 [Shouchella clausii]
MPLERLLFSFYSMRLLVKNELHGFNRGTSLQLQKSVNENFTASVTTSSPNPMTGAYVPIL